MALEIESFLGPLKWHVPIDECLLGPNATAIWKVHKGPLRFIKVDSGFLSYSQCSYAYMEEVGIITNMKGKDV